MIARDVYTEEDGEKWRPELPGHSADILPFYRSVCDTIPRGGVFLEVGIAFGRSLAFMRELRPDIVCIGLDTFAQVEADDTTHGHLITKHRGHFEAFLATAPDLLTSCVIVKGDLNAIVSDVDCCFIDADHSYSSVFRDIKRAAPLVKPGGTLAGHDYHAEEHPGVVRAVDELIGPRVKRHGRTCWWSGR